MVDSPRGGIQGSGQSDLKAVCWTEMNKRTETPPRSISTMPPGDISWFGLPRHRARLLLLFLTVTLGSFGLWMFVSNRSHAPNFEWKEIGTYPHDTTSFTQGLLWHNGFVYESTGHEGQSRIRKVDLKSGNVVVDRKLDSAFFGEGIAVAGNKIVQLTWQNRVGIVYDLDLTELNRFRLDDDAWGLTFDGQQLIMSDGTSTLRFLNTDDYSVVREVTVRLGARRVGYLNELEYINGLIYANVWQTDEIVVIQPKDGMVVGRIDLRELYPFRKRNSDDAVMNGIAIHPEKGTLLVTGKYWPKIHELQVTLPR
jgi:glutaminyl-peptide cyclotransferase